MTHVLIFSVILGVCCALAEKSEYTTTEQPKKLSNTEDRFLANIIHDKNSSELVLDSIDGEETKKTDKKPRTVLHRDPSLERDKLIYFRFNRSFLNVNLEPKRDGKVNDSSLAVRIIQNIFLFASSSCCGSKYSSGLARPDYNYNKIPVETGRYPFQYGERHPIDR